MAFWWQKQKLKWCNYKPNNAKERQQNQELEKDGSILRYRFLRKRGLADNLVLEF